MGGQCSYLLRMEVRQSRACARFHTLIPNPYPHTRQVLHHGRAVQLPAARGGWARFHAPTPQIPNARARFHIMGGQCSYLLRVEGPAKALRFVPDGEWKTPAMAAWSGADIAALLRQAEAILLETAARLRLPVQARRFR